MSDRFQNKFRIPSARFQNWDYGWNAAYFITICTKNRECYFGEIVETPIALMPPSVETPNLGVSTTTTTTIATIPTMQLSEIGKIANQYWNEIPDHFLFVELGEFIVMPNHIHGIIVINKPNDGRYDETPVNEMPSPTIPTNETNPTKRTAAASEKWNPGTLGVIINQFKRICTIHSRNIHADFGWQSRFHDHIIRNDESFQRISEYIQNNPVNWRNDKFYNP